MGCCVGQRNALPSAPGSGRVSDAHGTSKISQAAATVTAGTRTARSPAAAYAQHRRRRPAISFANAFTSQRTSEAPNPALRSQAHHRHAQHPHNSRRTLHGPGPASATPRATALALCLSVLQHKNKPRSRGRPSKHRRLGTSTRASLHYDAMDGYAVSEPPCSWHLQRRFCTYLPSRRQ